MGTKLQIFEFFNYFPFLAWNFTQNVYKYIDRVPNESYVYNLLDRYRIYILCCSEIFVEAKILPLPLQKSRKRAFFGEKSSLIIISSNTMIVFQLIVQYISRVIKLAPTSGHKPSLSMKKIEKWEIFNFADFLLKTHIPSFFYQTIETVSYIVVNICTSILVSYKNHNFFNLAPLQCPKIRKILPLPH